MTIGVSSNNAALTAPASVTVATGSSTATFTATATLVPIAQVVTVTATSGAQSQTATVTVAATVQVSILSCTPGTVSAPGTAQCTVTLTGPAATGPMTVGLASGNGNVTVPASVVVASGQSSAQFTATVAAVATDQTAVLATDEILTINDVSVTLTSGMSQTQVVNRINEFTAQTGVIARGTLPQAHLAYDHNARILRIIRQG